MTLPATFIPTLAGPLGVALTIALVFLLLVREALPIAGGRAARRWRFRLSLASAVLLIPFVAFVAARLALVSAPALASGLPTTATVGRTLVGDPVAAPTPGTATPDGGGAVAVAPPAVTPAIIAPPAGTPVIVAPASPRATLPTPGNPVLIANAVGGLRTGLFEVHILYTNTARSTTFVSFDLRDTQQPRLQSTTTYRGETGFRTTERIVVGGRSWTRQPGAAWSLATTAQDVGQEVGALLPLPGAPLSSASADESGALRWYDPARDADFRLELDPATNLPSRLEQTSRGTGTVLAVIYRGWNIPVSIVPPAER